MGVDPTKAASSESDDDDDGFLEYTWSRSHRKPLIRPTRFHEEPEGEEELEL